MRVHQALVDVDGPYRIHTEFHYNPGASRTIILVNGSLATTASFAHTLRYLLPHFNVVLYDQPYAGGSKAHNDQRRPLSKEDEAGILLSLIEHFRASLLLSFSWGGVAALLALAQRPPLIEKAVVASFAPQINAPMQGYLERAFELLGRCERENIARLVNDTLGQHLPSLFRRYNHRHISSLETYEYAQLQFHIGQVLRLDRTRYQQCFGNIETPLLFVNGALDIYTTADDARGFADAVRDSRFAVIPDAGHFLDLEHKTACLQMRDVLLSFLLPPSSQRQPVVRHWGNAMAS